MTIDIIVAQDDLSIYVNEGNLGTYVSQDDFGIYVNNTGDTMTNKITGIVRGQYGVAIALSAVDSDGVAKDLSAYADIIVRSISPDAQTTLSFTGAFVSSSGGTFSFTPSSGNTFDLPGEWETQAQFSDTLGVALALTMPFIIDVENII